MNISIDIGTSFSCLCIKKDGEPIQNVPIRTGISIYGSDYALPSAVFVNDNGEVIVGHAAMNSRKSKPQNFRAEFKRNIGEEIPIMLGNRSFLPEDLYTELFRYMKNCANKAGNEAIEKTYITYPASFSVAKKTKILKAAEAAGLFQIEMIDEPTAAALNYYRNSRQTKELHPGDTILVYDFGGGTFDVSVIRYMKDRYTGVARFQPLTESMGLEHCGGIDVDRAIYMDITSRVNPELRVQISKNPGYHRLLENQFAELAVRVKHHLSNANEFREEIPIGLDMFEYTLTADQMKSMTSHLVTQTIDCCKTILQKANLSVSELSCILLIGGSSRMPLVEALVHNFAHNTPVYNEIEPQLAVVQGALAAGEMLNFPDQIGLRKKRDEMQHPIFSRSDLQAAYDQSMEIKFASNELQEAYDHRGIAKVSFYRDGRGVYLLTNEGSTGYYNSEFHEIHKKQEGVIDSIRDGIDLTFDGKVLIRDEWRIFEEASCWTDICSIDTAFQTLGGLKKDGTVEFIHRKYDYKYKGKLLWKNIVSISVGEGWIVGLTDHGTVVAEGKNDHDQCNVRQWDDVVKVLCSKHTYFSAALTGDGRVLVATDDKKLSDCVSYWRNIKDIQCNDNQIVGLSYSGRVFTSRRQEEVSEWTDVVMIGCFGSSVMGVKSNGQLLVTGGNNILEYRLNKREYVFYIDPKLPCFVNDYGISYFTYTSKVHVQKSKDTDRMYEYGFDKVPLIVSIPRDKY